ncbi:MAG: outer membrane protein assembly factor BamD [Alphaproteobacteria bacterium]
MKPILCLLLFLFISCASNDTSELELNQNLYENNTLEDFELFENANKFINSGEYELALIELDKLEVLFPSSPYSNKGMLLNAYIHFLKKDYEKTRALAENYKKYYPGSKDIVYANYLDAMTYYILIKKPDYSQKDAFTALDKFNFILNAYPNSKYEIDIITKIQVIDNNLAMNKLSTAKFYLDKKNINGALIYLKDIFENHSSSLSIEETLFLLVKIYKSLKEDEISKNYAAILAYNFPDSEWYRKSYNLINDIEIKNNQKGWFEKFNPIKLIKNSKEEENIEIQIIE